MCVSRCIRDCRPPSLSPKWPSWARELCSSTPAPSVEKCARGRGAAPAVAPESQEPPWRPPSETSDSTGAQPQSGTGATRSPDPGLRPGRTWPGEDRNGLATPHLAAPAASHPLLGEPPQAAPSDHRTEGQAPVPALNTAVSPASPSEVRWPLQALQRPTSTLRPQQHPSLSCS